MDLSDIHKSKTYQARGAQLKQARFQIQIGSSVGSHRRQRNRRRGCAALTLQGTEEVIQVKEEARSSGKAPVQGMEDGED